MSEPLFKKLATAALSWRQSGWQCGDYPLIGEILRWQFAGDEFNENALKYLRKPQFRALEVYWHLRLARKTPHITCLYREIYGGDKREFVNALGIPLPDAALRYASIEQIVADIQDPKWAAEKKIGALYESATLAYPSYIFALAMGAGKTVLIGAIAATEFAMSLEYPKAAARFMKNALVFAPGTTILESLRELQDVPYENILPPTQHKKFLANIKLEYPRTGMKEIQAQRDSIYNIIVTNTEKISLRANTKRSGKQSKIEFEKRKMQDELTANLRLQKIASLPDLGVFSDEAHHTYGNETDKELKRMRETVNYINNATKIVAVINTTGTPYYKRELLKEVVVWYGLGEGIDDGILKSMRDGVAQYNLKESAGEPEIVRNIIVDFFERYGAISLPNFGKAKIAFYFRTQEHLDTTRSYIEESLAAVGESATQILVNTQQSGKQEIDEFNRLDSPESQKRVILLVGKGTEGWNCRSLFATALIKKQTASGTFVLQAATRCLRQVSGNDKPARVYLDFDNAKILDNQLQDNFRTDLGRITQHGNDSVQVKIHILKFGAKLPKLEITKLLRRVVRGDNSANQEIKLAKPRDENTPTALRYISTPIFEGTGTILTLTGETEKIPLTSETTDCYAAAMRIAANYHLPTMPILKSLQRLYPKGEMPNSHLYDLFSQVEEQTADYEITEEKITEALALIHVRDKDGNALFEQDADGVYVHTLRYSRLRFDGIKERGLLVDKEKETDKHDVSFHYTPYNFDSGPERDLFTKVLSSLNLERRDISCFLFTGGLTDTAKTDFYFEYKLPNDNYQRYFPDFVIVKNSGEFFVVEVKSEAERDHPTVTAKEKAIRKIADMQPDKFQYHIVYAAASDVTAGALDPVIKWIHRDSKR